MVRTTPGTNLITIRFEEESLMCQCYEPQFIRLLGCPSEAPEVIITRGDGP